MAGSGSGNDNHRTKWRSRIRKYVVRTFLSAQTALSACLLTNNRVDIFYFLFLWGKKTKCIIQIHDITVSFSILDALTSGVAFLRICSSSCTERVRTHQSTPTHSESTGLCEHIFLMKIQLSGWKLSIISCANEFRAAITSSVLRQSHRWKCVPYATHTHTRTVAHAWT